LRALLTLNLPTVCVTSALNFAGGIFLALCHDYIYVIENKQAFWQFPEFEAGMPIPRGFADMLRHLLTPKAYREVIWGDKLTHQKLLELQMVTKICKDQQ